MSTNIVTTCTTFLNNICKPSLKFMLPWSSLYHTVDSAAILRDPETHGPKQRLKLNYKDRWIFQLLICTSISIYSSIGVWYVAYMLLRADVGTGQRFRSCNRTRRFRDKIEKSWVSPSTIDATLGNIPGARFQNGAWRGEGYQFAEITRDCTANTQQKHTSLSKVRKKRGRETSLSIDDKRSGTGL